MRPLGVIALAFTAVGLSACAGSPAIEPYYNAEERSRLTYCVGMADTARAVATQKLEGVAREQLRQFYQSKPNTELHLATVDKVYGEEFTSAWDYTLSFFVECAANLAQVPLARVRLAHYCMQNQLIADVAHGYKTGGKPKDQAYLHFVRIPSETPKTIVDRVYASSKGRAEIKLELWSSCIAAAAGR